MKARVGRQYWLTRFVFQRALAFIYVIGFVIILRQYVPLLGENGILPARLLLDRVDFWQAPSLFWINVSDTFLIAIGWCGLALAITALIGLSESFGVWVSAAIWALLWALYLSFVNVGWLFYGFE